MKKHIYVMGLCYSHDASVAIIKDGVPIVAIQKERISRKKHDGSIVDINLDDCIGYCLSGASITLNDIDLFVENSPTLLYCKEKDNILGYSVPRLLDSVDQSKILQISHHLAHAYAAFGTSPYKESAVMIIDGQGNYKEDITEDITHAALFPKDSESSFIERESFYEFTENNYTVIRKNFGKVHKSFMYIFGLGHMYEKISSYVFNSRFDAGKLMGLAPYCAADISDEDLLVQGNPDGEIIYKMEWARRYKNQNTRGTSLEDHWGEYTQIAKIAQKSLEAGVQFLVGWFRKNTKQNNLCYSGGVSLNCPTNSIIKEDGGFNNIFIAPPASDVGVSLGCAFYGYLHILEKPKVFFEYSDYLGREYTLTDIESSLRQYEGSVQILAQGDDLYSQVARYISQGKIVGWFQGKSEFGPRALGNRSILGDPRNPKMKEILNSKVKFRESFRPFAPSVLQEYADQYFDVEDSPFMLYTANVVQSKRDIIPAVVHIDGTARAQTVTKAQNERYYSLIHEFYKITGVPMLVNTSFNKDEPIVDTPYDAINCFMNTNIDYLVLGDCLIEKI